MVPPFDTQKEIYLNTFRLNMTISLEQLRPPHAAYSPACYWHCSTESGEYWSIKYGTMADRDALFGFYFANMTGLWIDPCVGFSCSTGWMTSARLRPHLRNKVKPQRFIVS